MLRRALRADGVRGAQAFGERRAVVGMTRRIIHGHELVNQRSRLVSEAGVDLVWTLSRLCTARTGSARETRFLPRIMDSSESLWTTDSAISLSLARACALYLSLRLAYRTLKGPRDALKTHRRGVYARLLICRGDAFQVRRDICVSVYSESFPIDFGGLARPSVEC